MTTDFDYERYDHIRPILWTGDALELLDQRKLPFQVEHLACTSSDEVAAAIHALAADLDLRPRPGRGLALQHEDSGKQLYYVMRAIKT